MPKRLAVHRALSPRDHSLPLPRDHSPRVHRALSPSRAASSLRSTGGTCFVRESGRDWIAGPMSPRGRATAAPMPTSSGGWAPCTGRQRRPAAAAAVVAVAVASAAVLRSWCDRLTPRSMRRRVHVRPPRMPTCGWWQAGTMCAVARRNGGRRVGRTVAQSSWAAAAAVGVGLGRPAATVSPHPRRPSLLHG